MSEKNFFRLAVNHHYKAEHVQLFFYWRRL